MREKLIELLYHSGDECDQLCRTPQKGCHVCKYADCGAKCINVMEADHLIANGVTVREQGEWKWEERNRRFWWRCSVCDCTPDGISDFCPACGADMRVDKSEND